MPSGKESKNSGASSVDDKSRFNSLTLVSSEQTAQAGENAPFTSTIPSGDCVQDRTLPVCLIAAARVREVKPSKSIRTVSSSVPKRRTARPAFLGDQTRFPKSRHRGALLVPFPEQGDGVLHHNALLFRALEPQQPVLSITLSLAAKTSKPNALHFCSSACQNKYVCKNYREIRCQGLFSE